jgi:putative flippase GtrA
MQTIGGRRSRCAGIVFEIKIVYLHRLMKALFSKVVSAEVFRFVVVGGLSALIEYSLYFLFKPVFGYLVGNVIAFACTNVVTYILTRRYVFNSPTVSQNRSQEAFLFVLCLCGALIANQITLVLLVKYGAVDDRIAKLAAIAVAVVWNFFTRKHVVFKNRQVATQSAPSHDPAKDF